MYFEIGVALPLEIDCRSNHDDVIKFSALLSPMNSPHKGQWREALMFSLVCVWINVWVNNHEAGDLRRYRAYYDVIVMHRCLSFQILENETNPQYGCGSMDKQNAFGVFGAVFSGVFPIHYSLCLDTSGMQTPLPALPLLYKLWAYMYLYHIGSLFKSSQKHYYVLLMAYIRAVMLL